MNNNDYMNKEKYLTNDIERRLSKLTTNTEAHQKIMDNFLESQDFIIDGEYLENCHNKTFVNIEDDTNSSLERFKNSLFELNSSNSFRKSQSYPNNLLWTNILNNKHCNNSTDIELVDMSINPLVNSNHIMDEAINTNDTNDTIYTDEASGLIVETDNTNNHTKSGYFTQIYNWFGSISVKTEMLNKFISIFLHIFIMVIFEIYFYFNFVVDIEKEQFLEKIQQYIDEFTYNVNLDQTQKSIIYKLIGNKYNNTLLNQLYTMYIESLEQQKQLLHHLLIKSCGLAGIIGLVLFGLIGFGLYKRYKIKWKWIWVENFLMFALLGVFEYWFFMNVILNYNPITDAEIKYYVANQFVNYFNSTI